MDYTFKTISRKVLSDLHTPVSIYLKVRDVYPKSALLESSDFHGNENSLSYIALCPLASIGINNGECTAVFPDGKSEVTALTGTFNVAEGQRIYYRFHIVRNADWCKYFGIQLSYRDFNKSFRVLQLDLAGRRDRTFLFVFRI